jgi:hypothetical protein
MVFLEDEKQLFYSSAIKFPHNCMSNADYHIRFLKVKQELIDLNTMKYILQQLSLAPTQLSATTSSSFVSGALSRSATKTVLRSWQSRQHYL